METIEFSGCEERAENLIRDLADMFEDGISNGNEIIRFTPSVKVGRRYLAIKHRGYSYAIQIDVAKL